MDAIHLIDNYSYAVDTISVIMCISILVLIRLALYYSVDRKFLYIKRSVHFILFGALSNVHFAKACEKLNHPDVFLYIFRDINHICFMCCMFIFLMYIKNILELDGGIVRLMTRATEIIFTVALICDVLSPITHYGFYKDEAGWHDAIYSPYNVIYVYTVLLLALMIIVGTNRIVRPVRHCLLITALLVLIIMCNSAVHNSNTFTSFTYVLPIIMVLILLHSKPFDDTTGAISQKSFESYADRSRKNGQSIDYMVLQMNTKLESQIPVELGKLLSSFWRKYFKDAVFFQLDTYTFVLAISRTKSNGDVEAKAKELFYDIFPQYYNKYQYQYKMLGMFDVDFIRSSTELRDIMVYLFLQMEDNSVLVVDEQMMQRIRIMQQIKTELIDIEKKGDLDDARVRVFCQPIVNTKTEQYDTAEALMRLELTEGELIMPELFIPLAEYYGHIHALSKIMLRKVCKQLKKMEEEGYNFQRVSVNFAVSELRDEKFCSEILGIIEDSELTPEKIGIELTESQNESDFNIIRDRIGILKERGMTIYLDDFGTGYSNLDRILRLGLDVIKYNRSILLAADEDPNASFMIQHFAEAFRQFNYSLLFEGVETPGQEQLCFKCGADYLQGFKFSKPVPIEQLREFFTKTK